MIESVDAPTEQWSKTKRIEPNVDEGTNSYENEQSVYQDYRPMLERQDLDAVVIASPDHWHALHSIDAAPSSLRQRCWPQHKNLFG